jgi:hypothetical protein
MCTLSLGLEYILNLKKEWIQKFVEVKLELAMLFIVSVNFTWLGSRGLLGDTTEIFQAIGTQRYTNCIRILPRQE